MTIKLLKDIVYISDGNYSSKYPRNDEFVTKGIPFIRANNLVDNTVVDYDMLFISQEKHKELKKGHLKTNDVLLTTRGNIGRVSIVPDKYNDANINAQIVLLRCDKNIILPSYLLYCLQSDFCQRQMEKLETGTALKQLPVGRLSDLRINVVPIKEQEKIVKRLCVADSIIRNHKTLLDNLALLVKSRFIEMFGDVLKNNRNWDCSTIKKVAEVGSSKRIYAGEYVPAGIPFYRSKEIIELSKGEAPKIELFISKIRYEEIKEKYGIPQLGDILMTAVGTIGKFWVVDKTEPFYYKDGNVIYIRSTRFNKEFFRVLLENIVKDYKSNNANGSAYAALPIEKIKKMGVVIPPIELQNQFADFVAQVDKSKLAVQQSLKELETLKKSLMQQYFG